jgi:plastocyanin
VTNKGLNFKKNYMMKKILFVILMAYMASSCKKFADAPALNFDVSLAKTTYKVGEKINFQISGGEAHQISFYSGKVGNAYAFRDSKRVDALKELYLSFETHNAPTANAAIPKVLISTDFNGVYDYENLSKATWVDLTSKFTFGAPAVFDTGWTNSTTQEIFSFTEKGKPFYIAYKYIAPAVPTGTVPSANWRTRAHVLRGVTLYGTSMALANYTTMAWKQIKKNPLATTGSVVSSSIMLFGAPTSTSPYFRQEYEEWGISKKFQVDDIDLGVDYGTAIKQYVDAPLSNYSFTYDVAGTYTVTFVASNTTLDSDNKVLKELVITITP